MSTYRAFRVSPSGALQPAAWLVAVSDSEAISEAALLCEAHIAAIQLWQGARLVGTYTC